MTSFDIDIKNAVHQYCLRTFGEDSAAIPQFTVSDIHIAKMKTILAGADRKRKWPQLMRAACILVVLGTVISATIIYSQETKENWYISQIDSNHIVYTFDGKNAIHAVPAVRLGQIPEQLERKETVENDYYRSQFYQNDQTGEYLRFSYHRLTVREYEQIKKLKKKYGITQIPNGFNVVSYMENESNKISWYDPDSLIGYWIESNLPQELLFSLIDSMEIHLPVYIPKWMPDSYAFLDLNCDKTYSEVSYMDPATKDIITIGIADTGCHHDLSITGQWESKQVSVNGSDGTVYWGKGLYNGTVLILIDEKKRLEINIQTSLVDPDLILRIAESLERMPE